MYLQDWLDKEGHSRRWFGRQFNARKVRKPAHTTVDRWANKKSPTMPREQYLPEIKRITKGKVLRKDFAKPANPKEKL